MNNISYKIYTLGCKVNQYDSSSLSTKLEGFGFEQKEQNADLVIVNTCAVTKTAISKAKRALNQARKENPKAKIILMGCWPKTYKEEMKDFEFDLLWPVGKTNKLVEKIKKMFNDNIERSESYNELLAKTDKSRYFIKVQDGCEQFCTYCVIPYARGKIKSRNPEEVIGEIKNAIKKGFQEIVLSGIHLGLYGTDTNTSLFELLSNLIKFGGKFRLRLSSIEIGEVSDEIIELMQKSKKICNHLHIPLQAGTDKILKKMNRPYTLDDYGKKVKALRKAIPKIAITTDVIVGFPSETKNDFEKTCEFIKEMKFSRLHVFPFSAHEKTPAFSFPKQVSSNEKKERASVLRKLGKEMENKYQKEFWQDKVDTICIEKISNQKVSGLSEHYLQVECKQNKVKEDRLKVGKLVSVKIQRPGRWDLE